MAERRFGFSSESTAEQVTQNIDATGLTAIVTGGTSGIGLETVRVLALRGAHVYLTGRTISSATEARSTILKALPHARVDILELDLSSLQSVRKCAISFLALKEPLNILINNAGVRMRAFALTEDGIESQLGTNHVGHFLFTNLLLEKLKKTASESGKASRIVNVASTAMQMAGKTTYHWDKLNDKEGYNNAVAYGLSKLANVLHAQELTRRLKAEGITNVTINALHPGVIRTKLTRHGAFLHNVFYAISFPFWKTVPQGAATSCYVAIHPSLQKVSGRFFVDGNEDTPVRYHRLGGDKETAKELWDVSVSYTSAFATPII